MATFTNQAFLSYRNNVTASNIVTGEIREVLTAAKTAVTDTYTAGDTLTYVISLVNTGASALTGLTVTDDLGAYPFGTGSVTPLSYTDGSVRYFVNGALQPTPTVTAVSPLTVTGLSLPAGGSGILIYETTVNNFAPLGQEGTILNTATVTGAGIPTPITVSETVTAEAAAFLTISKAISPASVADNESLTYTFVIQNFGNTATVATDDVIVTDSFDPILNPITVTLNGTPLVEGTDGRIYHLSVLAAANMQSLLVKQQGIPYNSVSNTDCPMIKNIYLGEDSRGRVYDDELINNTLNANGITSAAYVGGRWATWGAHAASYSQDSQDMISVADTNMMMLYYLGNDFQHRRPHNVDKPMTANDVKAIVAEEQARLDALIKGGMLIYGTARVDMDSDALSDMMTGDFKLIMEVGTTPLCKSLTAVFSWTDAGLEAYYAQLAQ